jgi:tRNA nucleotidyltransferase (CCA-adding enzyme)
MSFTTRSTLQKRLSSFVDWVAPSSETRKEIKGEADKIREKITAEATKDKLVIASTPYAGSFQKHTGLKRHMRGHSEVEGQDIDIPFIVKSKDTDGNEIIELQQRFLNYAKAAFPDKETNTTKSSVELYMSDVLKYDLVPLLETSEANKQILIRKNGERRETSVLKHTEFIKERTAKSKELPGRVCFNECIRLIKWWRYFRQEESGIFDNEDNSVPSFLIDLLCAKAFDVRSVQETYAHTISDWFGYLNRIVKNKETIVFSDNYAKATDTLPAIWKVYDPVNPNNNVTRNWTNNEIEELASWLSASHNDFNRAIARNITGDDVASMNELVKIFGNPIKNNVE